MLDEQEESPAALLIRRERNGLKDKLDQKHECGIKPRQNEVRKAEKALEEAKRDLDRTLAESAKLESEIASLEGAYRTLAGTEMKAYSRY